MFVTKFDGSRQEFSRGKIIRTCLRMRATEEQAKAVADRIEREAYDGIRTKKIIELVFKYLKEYRPEVKHQLDLRDALSLLRPKPDFEFFIHQVLEAVGYEVEPSQIVQGKCVEHEIDGIACRGKDVIFVEVKHHSSAHSRTGGDVFLEARAVLEELVDGYRAGRNNIGFNKILIACNTKFSDHATNYARCRGIDYLGWDAPEEKGIERIVEDNKLYPITFLKDMDPASEARLGDAGIVILKQLVELGPDKLYKRTRIQKKRLELFVQKAKEILS